MIHCKAALSEHLLQVAMAQNIARVLGNGLNYEPYSTAAPLKSSLIGVSALRQRHSQSW